LRVSNDRYRVPAASGMIANDFNSKLAFRAWFTQTGQSIRWSHPPHQKAAK